MSLVLEDALIFLECVRVVLYIFKILTGPIAILIPLI